MAGRPRARRRSIEDALSFLRATLESTSEGILLIGADGRIVSYNDRFLDLWDLPANRVADGDGDLVAALVAARLASPNGFASRLRRPATEPSSEVLALAGGTAVEAVAAPHGAFGSPVTRWSFRDVTERVRAEGVLASARHLRAPVSELWRLVQALRSAELAPFERSRIAARLEAAVRDMEDRLDAIERADPPSGPFTVSLRDPA